MPGFNIGGVGTAGPDSRVDPGLIHRWSLRFRAIRDLDNVVLYAKSVSRPEIEIDRAVMHNKQNQLWRAGKHRWSPVNIEFYEVAQLNNALDVFKYWTNVIDYEFQTLHDKYKTNCHVILEDGMGLEYHVYTLYGVFPTKISPTNLDYTRSEIGTINVTMSIDAAHEEGSYHSSRGPLDEDAMDRLAQLAGTL